MFFNKVSQAEVFSPGYYSRASVKLVGDNASVKLTVSLSHEQN